ncbi:MAG: transcription antitermination factor NusB [Nitrospirota bacterium]|nr:transcription antitermination factor NusB [Nitrospirota bacterium]
MKRRNAREYALQMLFQHDFTGGGREPGCPGDLMAEKGESADDRQFAEELVKGAIDRIEEIDGAIETATEHWKLERMAVVDRNILRVAVYEIIYRNDIPSAVTINEALEIAKKYSSSASAPFINGLLDKIARNIGKA